jgi:hypothetical protein
VSFGAELQPLKKLVQGGTLEYDYRIYKDGSAIKVEITETRK